MSSDLVPWLALGSFVISTASLLYTIFNGRAKKTDERFDKVEKQHKDDLNAANVKIGALAAENDLLKNRIAVVEGDLRHLPDKDVTHRLELGIADLRSEMRGLSEKVKPIGAMADRIQEAILEKVMS